MTYQVNIAMSANTVNVLHQQGMALYAFKSVQSTSVGVPLVWLRMTNFGTNTSVNFEDQYQAYVSMSQIVPNNMIQATATRSAALGQQLSIDDSGTLRVSGNGAPDAVTILNDGMKLWTTGLCQAVSGGMNMVCAVPLNGKLMVALKPLPRILLMFGILPLNVGTVVFSSSAPGVLLTLSGAPVNVSFDVNAGWSWGGGSFGQSVRPNEDLRSLLMPSGAP